MWFWTDVAQSWHTTQGSLCCSECHRNVPENEKEYFWLECRQYQVFYSLSACMLLRHKRSTNPNVTAIIISRHGYISKAHIPFLSMGPSKMGKATQSQGRETPLLSCLQISCKSKSIVYENILALSTNVTLMSLTSSVLPFLFTHVSHNDVHH